MISTAALAARVAFVGMVLAGPVPAAAQVVVSGRVTSAGAAVGHAEIAVRDGAFRASAADDGSYQIVLPGAGEYVLRVTAIGYRPQERRLHAGSATGRFRLDVALRSAAIEVEPLVVTGTLRETSVAESPVKVEVVTARFLQRNLTNNLLESIQSLSGLTQQVDCGVCYTSNIRINGMEGPYTAVLIDGAPIMSSLATVYGLSGINPAIIEQVEVVKGPASTLYGSEAMGGVINVVTKDPRYAPRVSLTAYATSHGETSADFAVAPGGHNVRGLVSGSFAYNDRFVDGNGDGFSDFPLVTRAAVFSKLAVGAPSRPVLDLSARYYAEDRFGGVRGWTRADRGSGDIYGEFIRTRRTEVLASLQPPSLRGALRLDASASAHAQESWYGDVPYDATQHTLFGRGTFSREFGRHQLLFGTALRFDRYDDDTPATTRPERRLVPGIFVQNEITLSGRLTALAGLRLDRHAEHGIIVSPRLSARWRPASLTTLRANVATGFRTVNIFTEDHAALTGSREVVIAETLRPERSLTATASLNHAFGIGGLAAVLDADVFQTYFTNKIQPDYNVQPDRIVYANLDGHAVTRGVSATLSLAAGQHPLSGRIGGTVQEVYAVRAGTRSAVEFAPVFKGEATVSWERERSGTTVDWTARLVGPMALPRFPDRAARSPWFAEHTVQATQRLLPFTFVIAGVKNLFDYRQRDPLVNPDDPFGPGFDTFYVYGPVQGRRLLVGLQHNVGR